MCLRESQQRRREKDPEGVKARKRAWDQAHPENQHNYRRRRRARIKNAPLNDLTRTQEALVITVAHGVCQYCQYNDPDCEECALGIHTLEIDHITALENNGPNTIWNVLAACRICNAKKGTRHAPGPVQPLLL